MEVAGDGAADVALAGDARDAGAGGDATRRTRRREPRGATDPRRGEPIRADSESSIMGSHVGGVRGAGAGAPSADPKSDAQKFTHKRRSGQATRRRKLR